MALVFWRNAKAGDLIEFKRHGYTHWAVATGEGTIVHITGDFNKAKRSEIREETTEGVISWPFGDFPIAIELLTIVINNSEDRRWKPYSPAEIVRRARSKIGSWRYDLLNNNCEHFSKWCRYGHHICQQWPYANIDESGNLDMGCGKASAQAEFPSMRVGGNQNSGSCEVDTGNVKMGFVKVEGPAAKVKIDTMDKLGINYGVKAGAIGVGDTTVDVGANAGGSVGNGSVAANAGVNIGPVALDVGASIGRENRIKIGPIDIGFSLW